ncbi:MAG: hypothetical protein ACQEP9_01625 [Bacillota bacterium]
MNMELLVAGSFMIAIILQSILLLQEFFKGEKNFSVILFSYITSSFVYLSALLVFISTFYNQSKLELLTIENISSLTTGKTVIWIIIITSSITIFTILITAIKNKIKGSNKDSSSKYINQDQVKRLD